MASWKAPSSILEAPGLDFGGSGLNFPRFWMSQTMPEGLSGWKRFGNDFSKFSNVFGFVSSK